MTKWQVATAGGDGLAEGVRVEVFARPETISLGSGGGDGRNRLSGVVDSLLFNGANSRVLVRDGAGNLVEVGHSFTDGSPAIRPGETVDMVWRHEHCLCFALAG